MTSPSRDCSTCRFWSELIACAGGGTNNANGDTEAMCLSSESPHHTKYTTGRQTCAGWKKASHGAIDAPPGFGEQARAAYAEETKMVHMNGAPMFAPDGTMLDENGNRSIFDDSDD